MLDLHAVSIYEKHTKLKHNAPKMIEFLIVNFLTIAAPKIDVVIIIT